MSSGLPPEQIFDINKSLADAHALFLSMDGHPIIQITRKGRLLIDGQPEFGVDPTYESFVFTAFAEINQVEQDEIDSSGGMIQAGDRRLVTRTPVYNDDIVSLTDLGGIQQLTSNTGTGTLLTAMVKPNMPETYYTISFNTSSNYVVTSAAGSVGGGTIGAHFFSANSNLTLHSTSWFGDFATGDKLILRFLHNEFNVYRIEAFNTFGDYQCLVRTIGQI